MPKGPRGEKRPADVIGAAVLVGRIATGDVADTPHTPASARQSEGGKKGGVSKAAAMSPEDRSALAKKAAEVRWTK